MLICTSCKSISFENNFLLLLWKYLLSDIYNLINSQILRKFTFAIQYLMLLLKIVSDKIETN